MATRRTGPARISSNSDNNVHIRMYGQGLGDCFLLSFPRADASSRPGQRQRVYVLVDCGVIGGMPEGPQRMKAIVADIADVTGGELDLLIITHEHWDHVSGFVQAQDEWERINVQTLWTAWTESPDQTGLPGVLKRILEKQRRTLAQLADHALRFGLTDQLDTAVNLMSFLCDGGTGGSGFAAAPGVRDAFAAAKARARHHTLCEPGDVRPVPNTDTIAYVLGPPRDDAFLRQMRPSTRTPETYPNELRAMIEIRSNFNAFVSTILGRAFDNSGGNPADGEATQTDNEVQTWRDRSFPFESFLRVPLPTAEADVARQEDVYSGLDAYFDEMNAWRRIDHDWLGPAELFALQADHLTNNTSLVVAFELPRDASGQKKVLLFTGDAQVGNWLSWYDITDWRGIDGASPDQEKPDVAELLSRVAFYKVGHHGSHNATLSERGVEHMPRGDQLMAFVPVSKQVAAQLKRWTKMPLDNLLKALSDRAPGRVVLPNTNSAALEAIQVRQSPTMLPPVSSRKGTLVEGSVPLWIEVSLAY